MTRFRLALNAQDPFVVHLQFAISLWRARRACARIQAALGRTELAEVTLTLHLGSDLLATASLPCGTIGDALQGEPVSMAGLRAAHGLVEALWDLGPVFAPGPPERGFILHASLLTLGVTQALRVVYDDTSHAVRGGVIHGC
ncbi:hypothetical protein M8C13_38620 [Crossiella sp. SN42]|uniref:hypothetical protein n=1 Tax=Crossiella sp. SN42 TaxID=2944808 RepID=UPI00207C69ED|nr:hypothetical protein [Crossiella sp. SN42]MCO1581680.1 hypothetical protein [Crossiella sp. SN42]